MIKNIFLDRISTRGVVREITLHSEKRASCKKSVDILQELVTTSRYQNAFAWLATTCDNKSVASCQQACYKLSTDLLQDDYFNRILQLVSTNCKMSANDKLLQA